MAIQHLRGTTAEWASYTTPLASGQIGLELDAGTGNTLSMRIGNGVDAWADLPVFIEQGAPVSVAWGSITGTLASQTDLAGELAGKAATVHSHDGTYSPVAHNHAGAYDPAGSAAAALAVASAAIDNHMDDVGNPHSVTAAQVGAIPVQVAIDSKDPTGFLDRTQCTLTWDDPSRTLTLAPVSGNYSVYFSGVRTDISATKTIVIPDVTGQYFVYLDTDFTLKYLTVFNPTTLILNTCYVSTVVWSQTQAKAILFSEERHGSSMDSATHSYLHRNIGTLFESGFVIGNYSTTGNGNSDVDATLSLTNGIINDEDIRISVTHSATPAAFSFQQFLAGSALATTLAKIPVMYRSGTGSDNWARDTATNFPVKTTGTGRMAINVDTGGGVWGLTEATSTNFVAVWIVCTNDLREPVVAVVGQVQDSTLANAQANNTYSTLNFGNFPAQEFRLLYRIIYQTGSGYANAVKSRIREVLDFRTTGSVGGSVPASAAHNALTGLGSDDHQQYAYAFTNAVNLGNLTGATTLTLSNRNDLFYGTTTGATTWTFAGFPATGTIGAFTLELTNGGSQTQTWPAGIVKWDGGTAPTLTAAGKDILTFYTRDAGATWNGFLSAADIK